MFGVLGRGTDVHIAEYAETADGESCRVRLSGVDPDDLIAVAEHLAAKRGLVHALLRDLDA